MPKQKDKDFTAENAESAEKKRETINWLWALFFPVFSLVFFSALSASSAVKSLRQRTSGS
jgi:hypothetical protein